MLRDGVLDGAGAIKFAHFLGISPAVRILHAGVLKSPRGLLLKHRAPASILRDFDSVHVDRIPEFVFLTSS